MRGHIEALHKYNRKETKPHVELPPIVYIHIGFFITGFLVAMSLSTMPKVTMDRDMVSGASSRAVQISTHLSFDISSSLRNSSNN
jgi:hypothetical protein